jgi:hypothetical protein
LEGSLDYIHVQALERVLEMSAGSSRKIGDFGRRSGMEIYALKPEMDTGVVPPKGFDSAAAKA